LSPRRREPIAIGFNPKYVVELLTQMSSDQVTVALGGELDPGLIWPLTGDDHSAGHADLRPIG
jgi:DNA polymerase III sliding clamp (beta) subunit (PCNA family)